MTEVEKEAAREEFLKNTEGLLDQLRKGNEEMKERSRIRREMFDAIAIEEQKKK